MHGGIADKPTTYTVITRQPLKLIDFSAQPEDNLPGELFPGKEVSYEPETYTMVRLSHDGRDLLVLASELPDKIVGLSWRRALYFATGAWEFPDLRIQLTSVKKLSLIGQATTQESPEAEQPAIKAS